MAQQDGRTTAVLSGDWTARGLLDAVPRLDRTERLSTIPGSVPDPFDPPEGCRFHPRCPQAMDICRTQRPVMVGVPGDRQVCCHLYTGAKG